MQDNSGFFIISFSVGTPGTMVSIWRYVESLINAKIDLYTLDIVRYYPHNRSNLW